MKNVKEAVKIHIMALREEEKVPAEEDFIIARVNVAESAGGGREGEIMESVSFIQRHDITMPKTYY